MSVISTLLPLSASTFSDDIDFVIKLIAVTVGVWYILANIVFFGFLFKFRDRGEKAQYISGEEKHQKRWVTIPHYLVLICDIFLLVGAIQVWYKVKQDLPLADDKVRIIGQQWSWIFQHSGEDGKLDTPDDVTTVNELHVRVDKTYHFELQSKDVVHDFSVPVFRLKQDAVPGRTITGWFNATVEGTYDVQCAEMCGIGHGLMVASITVESEKEHLEWLKTFREDETVANLTPQ